MLKKMTIYAVVFFMLIGVLGENSTYARSIEATLGVVETILANEEVTVLKTKTTEEMTTENISELTTEEVEVTTETVKESSEATTETVKESSEATTEIVKESSEVTTEAVKKETKKETKKQTKTTETAKKETTKKETSKKETTKKETSKKETQKKQEKTFTVKEIEKKTKYATTSLNVRKGPSTEYGTLGALSYAETVTVTGTVNDSHWVRVEYKGKTGYASGKYLVDKKPAVTSNSSSSSASKVSGYPIKYSDSTCTITITKEWFENAYVYAAHITFSDYSRFGTTCGKGSYGSKETTTSAAKRVGALLAINGCYSSPNLNYPVARSGKVMNDKNCWVPAVYSRWNGKLMSAWETGGTPGIAGVQLSSLVSDHLVSDTFSFGPPILTNGSVTAGSDGSRAQRTFIGTNGNAGDIWLFVSDGRNNDGKSSGLTYKQCARYMQSKGCSFGVPLDGGGSTTMVWKGQVLNAAKGNQRSVVDFVYFK